MLKQFNRINSLKINEPRYFVLVVLSKFIKKPFWTDCVIIFFSQSIVFADRFIVLF